MFAFLRRHARLVGLLVTGCVALGVVRGWPGPSDVDPYASAIIRAHSRKMAADAQALREARTAVVHDSVTVTRAVATYHVIRDTTRLTDTVWVKQVLASSDSVVRACTELQSSCARFRVRADSVIAGLTLEHDALAAEVKALHGSRLGNAINHLKVPVAFLAGAWVGSRVVR